MACGPLMPATGSTLWGCQPGLAASLLFHLPGHGLPSAQGPGLQHSTRKSQGANLIPPGHHFLCTARVSQPSEP